MMKRDYETTEVPSCFIVIAISFWVIADWWTFLTVGKLLIREMC